MQWKSSLMGVSSISRLQCKYPVILANGDFNSVYNYSNVLHRIVTNVDNEANDVLLQL